MLSGLHENFRVKGCTPGSMCTVPVSNIIMIRQCWLTQGLEGTLEGTLRFWRKKVQTDAGSWSIYRSFQERLNGPKLYPFGLPKGPRAACTGVTGTQCDVRGLHRTHLSVLSGFDTGRKNGLSNLQAGRKACRSRKIDNLSIIVTVQENVYCPTFIWCCIKLWHLFLFPCCKGFSSLLVISSLLPRLFSTATPGRQRAITAAELDQVFRMLFFGESRFCLELVVLQVIRSRSPESLPSSASCPRYISFLTFTKAKSTYLIFLPREFIIILFTTRIN